MFRRNSSIVTILGLLLLFLIATTSCEKDDLIDVQERDVVHKTSKASIISLSQIRDSNNKLHRYISQRALNVAKSSNSTNGTILDTAHIQILEGTDFKNYIFKVVPDSTQSVGVLKNYMLVILRDSIQHQYMVTYPYTNQIVDTTNVLIEPVYGTDILNQVTLKCGGTGSYQSVWIPGGYIDNRCQSGEHTILDGAGSGSSDGCKYFGGKGSASRIYYDGYFTTQFVEAIPCTNIDQGNTAGGGGGSSNNSPPPDDINDDDGDDSITVGVTPNEGLDHLIEDTECDFLQDLLDNSTFKSRLNQAIFDAGDKNYEVIHEYTKNALGADDLSFDSLTFYQDQGTNNEPAAPVRRLPNNIIRPIVLHTHYEGNVNNDGTISMFSYPDLVAFLKDLFIANANGKDTGQMTSILVAANSTAINVYAIKKDPNSTIASNYSFYQSLNLQMTEAEKKAERDNYQTAIEDSENQTDLEIAILQLFEKMGLQLYRSKDVHSNWEQLTLDSNPSDPDKPKVKLNSCN